MVAKQVDSTAESHCALGIRFDRLRGCGTDPFGCISQWEHVSRRG